MTKKLFDDIPRIEDERVVLKQLTDADAPALEELVRSERAYRYLPAYLFEKQYDDMHLMIADLYGSCFAAKESLILGVELRGDGRTCGLAEFYGLRDDVHKISVGYRFMEWSWGRGVATETVRLMVDYLYTQTDTQLITASTMIENEASARVGEERLYPHRALWRRTGATSSPPSRTSGSARRARSSHRWPHEHPAQTRSLSHRYATGPLSEHGTSGPPLVPL